MEKWSDNFYYTIRVSKRKKGYATKMLGFALNEFKKFGFREVYGQSSIENISSAKVIETANDSNYYKIML